MYTLDAKTGIGRDANGVEVNLPQTGVTSWDTVVAVGGAFVLLATGTWLIGVKRFAGCIVQRDSHRAVCVLYSLRKNSNTGFLFIVDLCHLCKGFRRCIICTIS